TSQPYSYQAVLNDQPGDIAGHLVAQINLGTGYHAYRNGTAITITRLGGGDFTPTLTIQPAGTVATTTTGATSFTVSGSGTGTSFELAIGPHNFTSTVTTSDADVASDLASQVNLAKISVLATTTGANGKTLLLAAETTATA